MIKSSLKRFTSQITRRAQPKKVKAMKTTKPDDPTTRIKCASCGLIYQPTQRPLPECGSEDGPNGPRYQTADIRKFMKCVLGVADTALSVEEARRRALTAKSARLRESTLDDLITAVRSER